MLEKEEFLDRYKIKNEYNISGLNWEVLEEIYDDYNARLSEVETCARELEEYIRKNMKVPFHSLRCRRKDPEHLIEKIIRKRGREQSKKYEDINVRNYREIIRDLIGMRILILSKEEWEGIYDGIVSIFFKSEKEDKEHYIAEPPVAYTRYGDRDIFDEEKIHAEHSNKGYRSQHYIVRFKKYFCEIQVRTLAEEVFGEFDHKVKYPYRDNNNFLIRYTTTLSHLTGTVDELISTCFQMKAEGWESCNQYYEKDKYIDWKNISQKSISNEHAERQKYISEEQGQINAQEYLNDIILRKI